MSPSLVLCPALEVLVQERCQPVGVGLEKGHEYGQRDGVPLLQRQADVLPQQVGGSEKFEIQRRHCALGT